MSAAGKTFPITVAAFTRLRRSWHIYRAQCHLSRAIEHLAALDEEGHGPLVHLFRANEAFPRSPRP